MAGRKKPSAADAAAEAMIDARGQIRLPLDGQNYVLRPSRQAITAIERELRPVFALAQEARRGTLTLEEMAVCAAEMMHAYGAACPEDALAGDYKGAQVEKLADLIYEAGGPLICSRLMVVLSGAVNGGYTASGEAKAAATTA